MILIFVNSNKKENAQRKVEATMQKQRSVL